MPAWTWASAAQPGTSHLRAGKPIDDAHRCLAIPRASGELILAISCDGAGSARYGRHGAHLVARTFATLASFHLRTQGTLPSHEQVQEWIDFARDRLHGPAVRLQADLRQFACTFLATISDGQQTMVAHIGDGCAIARRLSDSQWQAITWPESGEYASTTFFVTDDPHPRLRMAIFDIPFDALVQFTDGLERIALDFSAKNPFPPFLDAIIRPVIGSTIRSGRDQVLSSHLKAYLASDTVTSRTDDDCTLLLAALR